MHEMISGVGRDFIYHGGPSKVLVELALYLILTCQLTYILSSEEPACDDQLIS